MAKEPEPFVKNPGRDFTRTRKISFETLIRLLLSMGGSSLNSQLLEYFSYNVETPSSSAFTQQRDKLLPTALKYLLHKFTQSIKDYKTYEGYRLIAFDGSALNIPYNPNDSDTYVQPKPEYKGYNLLHLNGIYDLCNKFYLDVCVQPERYKNERQAMIDLLDHSSLVEKVILLCDRGLESFNNFAHAENKGWKYIIRVKDISSNGILSGLRIPLTDEFDQKVNIILTRKQTKEVKTHPEIYKYVPQSSRFDYFNLYNCCYYPFSFRAIRVKVAENKYQCFITNLPSLDFPVEKIKELYHLRWAIETSFRELKYAIGLNSFHAKKVEYIIQEVFARIIMYNFCEIITLQMVIKQGSRKYKYQVNFTRAIQICKHFFRCYLVPPPDVEALIQKYILPIREGRNFPRKKKRNTSVSFNYRIA